MIAMFFRNLVVFDFSRFVVWEAEGRCFIERVLNSLYSNTWHSFNSFEMLAECNSFLQDIQKLSSRSAYIPVETEFEHCEETIY